jgi:hypothetical protein
MKNGRFLLGITVVIAIIFSGLAICARSETAAEEHKIRIGYFNTRAIAMAYTQSRIFNEKITKIVTQAKEAKASGNDKIYKKLDAELKMEQEKIHWQVFSNARIDDILTQVRPSYEQIAQKANVAAIAENVVYNDTKVELVDVTELVAEQFKPNEATKEKMQQIIKKPPASFEEMKQAESERKIQ